MRVLPVRRRWGVRRKVAGQKIGRELALRTPQSTARPQNSHEQQALRNVKKPPYGGHLRVLNVNVWSRVARILRSIRCRKWPFVSILLRVLATSVIPSDTHNRNSPSNDFQYDQAPVFGTGSLLLDLYESGPTRVHPRNGAKHEKPSRQDACSESPLRMGRRRSFLYPWRQ
jgi:hypothetical protein